MSFMTNSQISELLTRMVEQNAPDTELADVIEYSKELISWKRGLYDIFLEKGDDYFDSPYPSLHEVTEIIIDLAKMPFMDEKLEDVLYYSATLIDFYKELEKIYTGKNIELYLQRYANNTAREDEDHNEYPELEN